jgi:cell filamentation protein
MMGISTKYSNGTLRNLLGLTDANALGLAEATLTALRIAELNDHPLTGRFDLEHLKAIHRHIFQDVYVWAGELRQVDISKGNARFAHFAYIEDNARALFSQVASERFLRDLPADQLVARMAY